MTRKFWNTLKLAGCMIMARTFGQYMHSRWNGEVNGAVYTWRGRCWFIPLGPMLGRDES